MRLVFSTAQTERLVLQHGGRLQGGQNPLAGSRLQTKKRRLFLDWLAAHTSR